MDEQEWGVRVNAIKHLRSRDQLKVVEKFFKTEKARTAWLEKNEDRIHEVLAYHNPKEEENKMAEKKKSAGKGKAAAAAAAAAKAKANKEKKEEPVTKPETQEAVDAVTKATEEQAAAVEKKSQAHKVLDALFATVLEEADIPDTSQFTEEQIKNELKENAGLLTPEDKPAILALEEGEMIWDFLCGLRKELAGEKLSKQTSKGKGGKAKADGGKKGEEKGKKSTSTTKQTATEDRDQYGFKIGSNGHKFVEYLKKEGPKTMAECKKAPWNPTHATFNDPMKKLIAAGKAVKHQDGKIELIG